MTNSDPRLSAESCDGPDTPHEALDRLIHEAGWVDEHGGDHHEDDCWVCRSIAMVRAGLNHAYPPSHADGTFPDAQPAAKPVAWCVLAENGNIRMWSTVNQDVADFAASINATLTPLYPSQPSPAATVETTSHNLATGERDNEETDPTYFHSSAATGGERRVCEPCGFSCDRNDCAAVPQTVEVTPAQDIEFLKADIRDSRAINEGLREEIDRMKLAVDALQDIIQNSRENFSVQRAIRGMKSLALSRPVLLRDEEAGK